jgi:hypothetical protein
MIDILYFSWFRMTSGILSEAVLVNLNDPRYFQHGGNLMVNNIFSFSKDQISIFILFRLIIRQLSIVVHIFVKQVTTLVQLLVIACIYVKLVCKNIFLLIKKKE